ncbi:TPA: hypothetical protein ACWLUJ_005712 [Pseudomonas aeruginosa]|nr:hypothetical protein [Pseudomonas aeruginosa]EIU2863556.1 hypothetical protein [Pseudomonas aeruginosa]HEJ2342743.1 hypothetical protein [Pseudomonas aeruginosa]HEK3716880.1 hypothetical protein [Pseudomonas aeruginosa]
MNPQDEFWQLLKAGELIELDASQGRALNIAATFGSDAESILAIMQTASGVRLSESQTQDAIATGLAVSATGEPSVRSLVEHWEQVAGLESFAAAVKAAMIPA